MQSLREAKSLMEGLGAKVSIHRSTDHKGQLGRPWLNAIWNKHGCKIGDLGELATEIAALVPGHHCIYVKQFGHGETMVEMSYHPDDGDWGGGDEEIVPNYVAVHGAAR